MTQVLKVAEFHSKPYGRLPEHDPEANGQLFRTSRLRPALQSTTGEVVVDFSGISVVGASFLDEAIAGLIYHDGFTEADLRRRLRIVIPHDATRESTAWRYVHQAEERVRPLSLPVAQTAH